MGAPCTLRTCRTAALGSTAGGEQTPAAETSHLQAGNTKHSLQAKTHIPSRVCSAFSASGVQRYGSATCSTLVMRWLGYRAW